LLFEPVWRLSLRFRSEVRFLSPRSAHVWWVRSLGVSAEINSANQLADIRAHLRLNACAQSG
jgi:hypothetical protein